MQTFRKEKLEDAAAVLTDEQKKTWKDLIGEPFDFEAPLRRATAGER